MPHGVRLLALVLLAACATDPEPALGTSRVTVMELPVGTSDMQWLSIASPCFEVPLATPHECSVVERYDSGERVMPRCDDRPDVRPCYRVTEDAQNCHYTPEMLKLDIVRAAPPAYPNLLVVQCVSL